MRLLVVANTVPFIRGGADYLVEGLVENLKKRGHDAELMRLPFNFSSQAQIESLMEFYLHQNFNKPNGISVDKLISLQFPCWGVQHDDHVCWIMHQHRAVYDLNDKEPKNDLRIAFKEKVTDYDNHALSEVSSRYAISHTVARRLNKYNGLIAEPLYHPPYAENLFYCEEPYDFIFCPSRLETLKRQELLIEAMNFIESPVSVIISGVGGQELRLRSLIEKYNLQDRIRLTGHITEQQKLAYYARALAVYFAPFDEDYGYITLESMLSAKPVITASDSGGPLEFIRDGENGWVVSPEPRAVAQCIDDCYNNKALARDMGEFGRELYGQLDISWDKTVSALIE